MPAPSPAASAPQTPRNPQIQAHAFLADMSRDAYFPPKLVDQGKAILNELCLAVEGSPPQDLDALTHAATLRFNELAEAFDFAARFVKLPRVRTSAPTWPSSPKLTDLRRRTLKN